MLLEGRVVPGLRARLALRQEQHPPAAVERLAEGRPLAGDRAAVHEVAEARVQDRLGEVLGRDVVLVHHHHELVRVGHEEVAQVREHGGQRGRADLAEGVAQVQAALALAGESEPGPDPQPGVERLLADAVLLHRGLRLRPLDELRAHPAAGKPVAVVGVDQQPADAVVELIGDGRVLLGREPAGERHRHRVVRRGEHQLVDRLAAELVVPVARPAVRRGDRRAAAAHERADRERHDQGAGQRRDQPPPAATARAALGALLGRPVDEAEDRRHALVDQVGAGQRQEQLDDGVARHQHHHPGRDQAEPAQPAQQRALGLDRQPCGGGSQRRSERRRLQVGRSGCRHHGAAPREDPRGSPQVHEVGVPDRTRRRAGLGPVHRVERERAEHAEGHHEDHAAGGGRRHPARPPWRGGRRRAQGPRPPRRRRAGAAARTGSAPRRPHRRAPSPRLRGRA